jgi:hypothetical protein
MKRIFAIALSCIMFISATPVYADGVSVYINDTPVTFSDAQPVIVNSRTMIPLRGLFEQLGYNISWNSATKTATLSKSGKDSIVLIVDDNNIYTGNKTIYSDVPPQIIGNRMYLPLSAVGDAANIEVSWDSETKTVTLADKNTATIELSEEEIYKLVDSACSAEILHQLSIHLTGAGIGGDKHGRDMQIFNDCKQGLINFLSNKSLKLNSEYKQELLDILQSTSNEMKLTEKLGEYDAKMCKISDTDGNTLEAYIDTYPIDISSVPDEYVKIKAKADIVDNMSTNTTEERKAYQKAKIDVFEACIDVCNKITVSDENEKKSLLAQKLICEYELNAWTCAYNADLMTLLWSY